MNPTELVARVRSLWRGTRHRGAVETEMLEEFSLHIELRIADLIRRGLTEKDAARQARLEFGHVDSHRTDARKSRGFALFDQIRFSVLDIRLGLRMMLKYPGLSLVSVVGMAVAIAISTGAFSLIESILETRLPLPEGDRVVALRNSNITEPRWHGASLRDYLTWRSDLRSVRDLAAFTTVRRNLVVHGSDAVPVNIVRMSASGFTLARTAPIKGRMLLEDDERTDARVVVISFDEWHLRFADAPDIIGRSIGLGTDPYTIVGVMPKGFRFPVNDRYWIPLSLGPLERAGIDEVSLTVAARLADGSSLQSAQAELAVVGSRLSSLHPGTHRELRPQLLAYTRAFFGIDDPLIVAKTYLFRALLGLLVVVAAVNVAILVYARTATRVGEIAIRTALGASRARVVTQLFAEALALSTTAAAVGLAMASFALEKLEQLATLEMVTRRLGELPFWVDLRLSSSVVIYALALSIVGAAVVGVVPALKATGRGMQASLQQLSGRSSTRMELGRAWTTLIVAQVAIAVAVLPFAVHYAQDAIRSVPVAGYPTERFLRGSLTIDEIVHANDTGAVATRANEERFRTRSAELIRRLEIDPLVVGVTIRSQLSSQRVEVEDVSSAGLGDVLRSRSTNVHAVGTNLFTLHDMPIVAGRTFSQADADAGIKPVIVNRLFARTLLRDTASVSSSVGRRIRIVRQTSHPERVETGPWLEVVGVVEDFTDHETKRVYVPSGIAQFSPPVDFAIRLRGGQAMSFAPRLREMTLTVDPALQIDGLISATEQFRQLRMLPRYYAIATGALTLSVLLLSAAGIYAMMSFIVARRRREIGIRVALGADARQLLRSIFTRAGAQIGIGILVGLAGTLALERIIGKGAVRDGNLGVLFVVAAGMATVGLLAALEPARRGLAVHPTEALRDE